jgi:two-component system cell cycle sensor histidine kinase/response regulator CckA
MIESRATLEWTGAIGTFGAAGIPDSFTELASTQASRDMAAHLAWQASLIDAVQQSVITSDLRGVITSWNRSAATMFGWKADEVLGRDVREILYGPGEGNVVDMALASIGKGSTLARERQVKCKSGHRIWIAVTAAPIRNEAGVITHVVATSSDITERRRLESQFHQAQKMEAVGRLAGGVAHDFNNLLTVMQAHAEFLSYSIPRDSELREDLEMITKSAERASSLTRQLLAFSRQQVMRPQSVHPNEVISNLEKMLVRLIGEDIELRIDLHPDVPTVMADPGQLEQAIVNLIVNARDAMPRGGPLRITSQHVEVSESMAALHDGAQPGHFAAIGVSDTGMGMSAAVRARIFEPFFTTKQVGKGTGLGLASVYGMVKQSGGFIDVQSVEDKGSTFTIFLPATMCAIDATSGDEAGHLQSAGSETLLLVEDQSEVRAIARRILTARGYVVVEASNGVEALERIDGGNVRIDMVIADAVMPKMGGSRLLEEIRPKLPNIPVLFVSGYTDQELASQGVLGADIELLHKPFRSEELLRRVRSLLDAASDARRLA